jgi:hypothetical protein
MQCVCVRVATISGVRTLRLHACTRVLSSWQLTITVPTHTPTHAYAHVRNVSRTRPPTQAAFGLDASALHTWPCTMSFEYSVCEGGLLLDNTAFTCSELVQASGLAQGETTKEDGCETIEESHTNRIQDRRAPGVVEATTAAATTPHPVSTRMSRMCAKSEKTHFYVTFCHLLFVFYLMVRVKILKNKRNKPQPS